MTDKSTMVKRGQKGDASVLRPTIMFCVPLILDRIYKGVTDNIRKKGEFVTELMDYCIKYKIECSKKGQITPIMDRLIFKQVQPPLLTLLVKSKALLRHTLHDASCHLKILIRGR